MISKPNPIDLTGKIAVVTGAGRGIGQAIAIGLGNCGAAVCCASRTEAELRETAATIEKIGSKAIFKVTDVKDEAAVNSLFAFTQENLGGVDIVIINAGITTENTPVETSDSVKWREALEVNLFGAYHTVKAAIPYLKQRGAGKIILIGSGLGHKGFPGTSSYSCSKSALWMFTRILAQELIGYNIAVNELIPGPVKTAMDKNITQPPTVALPFSNEWYKEPEDVVPLLLFLVSQPEGGPTGQSFSLLRRDV